MQILLFFFLLIFLIVIPIIFFFTRIVGAIFRPRNRNGQARSNTTKTNHTNSQSNKKIFDKSEGEYVDYVEVSDDSKSK